MLKVFIFLLAAFLSMFMSANEIILNPGSSIEIGDDIVRCEARRRAPSFENTCYVQGHSGVDTTFVFIGCSRVFRCGWGCSIRDQIDEAERLLAAGRCSKIQVVSLIEYKTLRKSYGKCL